MGYQLWELKVFLIHILSHSEEMTFNRPSHVFNAVHCFTSLGCLMSLEDGTHMDIFPKTEMRRVQKQGAHQSLGHKKNVQLCRSLKP